MATENNSAGFDNPTDPVSSADVQEVIEGVRNLGQFVSEVAQIFAQGCLTDQTERRELFLQAIQHLADAFQSLASILQSINQGGLYSQFVRLRNAYNILNEALDPLRGNTEHVPEDYITVLQPAILAMHGIAIADDTVEEATLTVEFAIPEHVQTDSSSNED